MTAPLGTLGRMLALATLVVACQATREPVVTREYGCPPVVHATLGSMHNVSVSGSLWFGSLPAAADLDLAHRRGIETVIDLTTPAEAQGYDVASVCKELGMRYVSIGVECRDCIDDPLVDEVLAALRTADGGPLLLFCNNGSRAAMIVAIHRCVDEGVSLEEALTEARRAGMKPGEPELFVKNQVARLSKKG